ncbi:hypothetical protein [Mycoplasma hafezii]|uniref:hypothetical protein n=1 Tax=Mycoplasma hafezii TaxID=525886 RepID=UPI003CF80C19
MVFYTWFEQYKWLIWEHNNLFWTFILITLPVPLFLYLYLYTYKTMIFKINFDMILAKFISTHQNYEKEINQLLLGSETYYTRWNSLLWITMEIIIIVIVWTFIIAWIWYATYFSKETKYISIPIVFTIFYSIFWIGYIVGLLIFFFIQRKKLIIKSHELKTKSKNIFYREVLTEIVNIKMEYPENSLIHYQNLVKKFNWATIYYFIFTLIISGLIILSLCCYQNLLVQSLTNLNSNIESTMVPEPWVWIFSTFLIIASIFEPLITIYLNHIAIKIAHENKLKQFLEF